MPAMKAAPLSACGGNLSAVQQVQDMNVCTAQSSDMLEDRQKEGTASHELPNSTHCLKMFEVKCSVNLQWILYGPNVTPYDSVST